MSSLVQALLPLSSHLLKAKELTMKIL